MLSRFLFEERSVLYWGTE